MDTSPPAAPDPDVFTRPAPPPRPWCLFLDIDGTPDAERVDVLFDPLRLPVAGVHGFERRNAQGHIFRPGYVGAGLSLLRAQVRALARSFHGVLLEDKGCAFEEH